MILKQSMLANNEGLPEGFVLDSKDKKRYQKKKYNYDKM